MKRRVDEHVKTIVVHVAGEAGGHLKIIAAIADPQVIVKISGRNTSNNRPGGFAPLYCR